jgi:hypothetical protein
MVFTVSGASATVAQPISLADAGLKERGHLQWGGRNRLAVPAEVSTAATGRPTCHHDAP